MCKRAVITGIGILSPIGNTTGDVLDSLKNGRNGFQFELEVGFVTASVKDFNPEKYLAKKDIKRSDTISQLAIYAAYEALADAGNDFKEIDPFRAGIIIGSGIGGIRTTEEQIMVYHNRGGDKVSAFTVPSMIGNMPAGLVSIRTGFKGVSYSPVTACASSAHAIGEAFRNIKHGYLDVALAGGTESAGVGFTRAAFNNMKALSRSKDPNRASIPFDKERDGFVLAEGSTVIVLEEYEHAIKRGAKIYAEVIGYGATTDAYHETAPSPDGEGAAKAMQLAFEEAKSYRPDVKVNYINAHGTSTPINDRTETVAIKRVFGDATGIAINSSKSFAGHMLGAAGAFEAAVTALQIKNGFIHPTLGYQIPDPDCDLDYVTSGIRDTQISAAISNSLGFGGHNASLCIAAMG